jgi:hypothetical protein
MNSNPDVSRLARLQDVCNSAQTLGQRCCTRQAERTSSLCVWQWPPDAADRKLVRPNELWTLGQETSCPFQPQQLNRRHTRFENFETWPDSRRSLFRRHIKTPYSLKKWFSTRFLPRTQSVCREISRRGFPSFVLLGPAATLGYE